MEARQEAVFNTEQKATATTASTTTISTAAVMGGSRNGVTRNSPGEGLAPCVDKEVSSRLAADCCLEEETRGCSCSAIVSSEEETVQTRQAVAGGAPRQERIDWLIECPML